MNRQPFASTPGQIARATTSSIRMNAHQITNDGNIERMAKGADEDLHQPLSLTRR
jgi:hypothetical protein